MKAGMMRALMGCVMAAAGMLAAARLRAVEPGTLPGSAAASSPATQPAPGDYAVTNTVKIPGEGAWDPWSAEPVTLDDQGKLLYVSRYHRTQAIDVSTGKVVGVIPGIEPRMTAVVPEAGRGFITENSSGSVTVFDLKTFAVLGKIEVGDNPHAIIYDPTSKRVLVACEGRLVPIAPDIDLKSGKPDEAIEFDGSPGSMVADGQGMVYLNLVDKNQVAVIDTRTMSLATLWQIADWYGPRGIAMDRERSRLYLGCRARVVVLSAVDGREIADVTVGSRDVWAGMGCVQFIHGKAYATCGEGVISVIGQKSQGEFYVEKKVEIPHDGWSMGVDKNGTIYMPAAAEVLEGRRKARGIELVTVAKK